MSGISKEAAEKFCLHFMGSCVHDSDRFTDTHVTPKTVTDFFGDADTSPEQQDILPATGITPQMVTEAIMEWLESDMCDGTVRFSVSDEPIDLGQPDGPKIPHLVLHWNDKHFEYKVRSVNTKLTQNLTDPTALFLMVPEVNKIIQRKVVAGA